MTYQIELVTDKDHARRAVAFLVSNDKVVTAKSAFDKLEEDEERQLRTQFDSWVDGKLNKKWFHGWNQSEFHGKYVECFVFKLLKLDCRFYAFKCHPKPINNRRFEICVIVIHATKKQWKTDESHLKKTENLRNNHDARRAIEDCFK